MSERMPDPVRAATQRQPEALAIVTPTESVTYADLDRRVSATADRLRALGLVRGDRLALYRSADVSYLVLLLAAFRAGVVACPLNTRQPAAAVRSLLERIGCDTLVASPDPVWTGLCVIEIETSGGADAPGTAWRLDAPATLVFTSGSTGTPKAALHTLGNHVASARGSVTFFDLQPGDRWLLNLPLYHVGGFAVLVRCVLAGATVVLPGESASIEDTVATHGVTHLSLVATQLLRVLRDGRPEALANTKSILLGGSAIPLGLLDAAVAQGLPIHTSYGMSEMASTITATPPDASREALATSGIVLPHREVRLADDSEILVRGATLFAGYVEGKEVERPEANGGWFPTGDLGAWTEADGQRMLRVVGRKDHLFISGGENVQPEEVEAALGQLPGIRQAVVVPVADAEFGQRPVAFVEAERWAPEAWRKALTRSLARFKIPIAFHPWPDDAQRGMKVRRSVLQKLATRGR
jgi:O-succinylbenzoic acid--CoA ligase